MAAMRHLIGSAALLFSVACPPAAGLARAADAPSRGESPGLRIAVGDSDPATLFALGQRYMLGQGVTQDLATAEALFAKAASAGNAEAADAYGLLVYQRGDHARAMPYVEAAAARGDPRAQYFLGLSLFNGDAAAKDWVRGYALVSLADRNGLAQAGPALAQMDQFLSPEQRQQAAGLTVEMTSVAHQGVAQTPEKSTSSPAADPPHSAGRWKVQLGVFRDPGNASALLAMIENRPELAGHPRIVQHGKTMTTLQVGGFADSSAALAACRALSAAGIACMATR
jgi:TPR repeat protein